MTGPALRLARLLPLAACLLAPLPAMAEPDRTPPADGRDIERSAAMAQGLAAAPGAGAEGRTILLTMAVQGHAQSQYLLGVTLLDESGTARDPAAAVEWLAQAAAQGHARARARLAGMAATGDAAAHLALGLIERDRAGAAAAALHHLHAAAAAGDPQGLLALGILYRTGGAVERDETYAAVLFRGAAAAAMAAVLRARQEADAGLLGPESDGWLEHAAARTRAAQAAPPGGDPQRPELFARYWVGLMLLAGAGTAADAARGLAHHRAAAERAFALAEFSLGLLHERGHGLPRDPGLARRWFAHAAHGHPLAAARLEATGVTAAGEGAVREGGISRRGGCARGARGAPAPPG